VCVCATSAYAQHAAPWRVHLAFDSIDGTVTTIQAAAVAEAAELWKPYGVLVHAGGSDNCDTRLTVTTLADRAPARGGDLGSIRFGADGIPDPHIVLHYPAVVQLAMGTTAFGTAAREWPLRVQEEVIARAVGRTLAHEIGHYLLQWPHHASAGLMRSRQGAAALASPDRARFALTPSDVARLSVVRAAGVLRAE
jgi:hypothetical protein